MDDPIARDHDDPLTDAPERPSLPPLPMPPPPRASTDFRLPKTPVLALVLSLFPGVGQIYNGQPAKAFTFFFGFVFAIYGTAQISPLPFALLIPFVYFYNLVDAWRTASLINARAQGGVSQPPEEAFESPAWGATLLILGAVLLLNNLGWLRLAAFARYWPVMLIAAGGVFLLRATRQKKSALEVRDRFDERPL